MKHGEGKDAARQLYIEHSMTFQEIADRIGRSEKTVRTWSDEENWRAERERLLALKVQTHEKLYLFVNKMTDRLISDCDAGNEISPHSLHAIKNLAKTIKDIYAYEEKKASAAVKDKSESAGGITAETLAEIEQKAGLL